MYDSGCDGWDGITWSGLGQEGLTLHQEECAYQCDRQTKQICSKSIRFLAAPSPPSLPSAPPHAPPPPPAIPPSPPDLRLQPSCVPAGSPSAVVVEVAAPPFLALPGSRDGEMGSVHPCPSAPPAAHHWVLTPRPPLIRAGHSGRRERVARTDARGEQGLRRRDAGAQHAGRPDERGRFGACLAASGGDIQGVPLRPAEPGRRRRLCGRVPCPTGGLPTSQRPTGPDDVGRGHSHGAVVEDCHRCRHRASPVHY